INPPPQLPVPTFDNVISDPHRNSARITTDTIHSNWICKDIVQSTADTGYIAIGSYQISSLPITAYNTLQYFKSDMNGKLMWASELPPYVNAEMKQVIRSQNGYLLNFDYNQSTVMEVDEDGNKLWAK